MANTEPTAPNSKPVKRRKVDASLQYRWGVIGLVLAVGFFSWYLSTSGDSRQPARGEATRNLEKIVCPRCRNLDDQKASCSLCGGLGFIWVNLDIDPGPRGRQRVD